MNSFDYRNPSRIRRLLSALMLLATVSIATAATKPVDRTPPVGYDPTTSVGLTNSIHRRQPTSAPELTFTANKILGDVDEIQSALDSAPLDAVNSAQPTVRVIITLRPVGSNTSVAVRQTQIPALSAALAGTSSSIVQTWQHFPLALAEVTQGGLDKLLQSEAVGGLELDRLDDLHLTSSRAVMGSDAVNAQGHEGGGTRLNDPWEIAIIDTGVLSGHTAFGGRISAEACYNLSNTCPNGSSSMTGTGAGAPCTTASCDHGTHVAGIAASQAANAEPGGNANKANIIAINVFEWIPANLKTQSYSSSQISALDYVYDRATVQMKRVAAVNMSLGGGSYSGTCDTANPSRTTAIQQLRDVGVMVVVSSGNSYHLSTMGAPACISHAIAVGNTNDDDTISPSSNASTAMDLWAPGNNITSSVITGTTDYEAKTGTSMAAPQVAGAAAVLYDCEAGFNEASNLPATASYDDFVLVKMKGNGVSVTDSRVGGSVTKPRLHLQASSLGYYGNQNDAFATPTTLSGATGSQYSFTPCASLESGESHPGFAVASKWFSWTAPGNGSVEFSTCDARTTADTVLAAYRGTSLASLVLDGSSDDDAACTTNTVASTHTVKVTAGDNIRVAVMAYAARNTSHGYYNLNWDFTPNPSMTSPVPGSTLNSSNAYFEWDDNGTAVDFWLIRGGSSPTGNNYFDSGALQASQTDFSGSGIPTDGSTVHISLYFYADGAWQPVIGYTYTAAASAPTPPSMTSPVAGSTLTSSDVNFTWNDNGTTVTNWSMYAGSTVGNNNYFTTAILDPNIQGVTATGFPVDGSPVHVTLLYFSQDSGIWTPLYYVYTAASIPAITSPVPGSTLADGSPLFSWTNNAPANNEGWRLSIGSSMNASDLWSSGVSGLPPTQTSVQITGLPTDGRTLYVRLEYIPGGASWLPIHYTYTAATVVIPPPTMTSPVPNSTLSSSNVNFDWDDNGTIVELWAIQAGSASLGSEYFYSGQLPASQTDFSASGIPTNSSTVHVTLSYRIGGVWNPIEYTYTAAAPVAPTCKGLAITVDMNIGDIPTNGSDVILGTPGPDIIDAKQGDDTVCGMGGNDTIKLGVGNDYAEGGDGDDFIQGNGGNDLIYGGAGADTVYGGGGLDTIYGDDGEDYLYGGSNSDTLYGGNESDHIYGQNGHDQMFGGRDGDFMYGGTGGDTVQGNDGSDVLYGQGGADTIIGDNEDDILVGGAGPDSLSGGMGTDSCNGQTGIDTHDTCESTSGFPSPPVPTQAFGFATELQLAEAIDNCDDDIATCLQ